MHVLQFCSRNPPICQHSFKQWLPNWVGVQYLVAVILYPYSIYWPYTLFSACTCVGLSILVSSNVLDAHCSEGVSGPNVVMYHSCTDMTFDLRVQKTWKSFWSHFTWFSIKWPKWFHLWQWPQILLSPGPWPFLDPLSHRRGNMKILCVCPPLASHI
jgi:hypothetical protein